MYYPQYRKGQRTAAKSHYGNLFDDRFVTMRYAINLDLVKAKIIDKKGKLSILDAGGYTADNLEFWKRSGIITKNIEYHVADYDIGVKKIVESRGGSYTFYDLNFDKLTELFPNKKFDLIICTEVLEHLLDPHRQMKYFQKLLKKDGNLLISLPNENTIIHRLYSLLGYGVDQFPFALYKHLHFPTIKQSRGFVSEYFKIIKSRYYYSIDAKSSKFGFLWIFSFILPEWGWRFLVNQFPSLLARGTVFYLEKK